MFGGNKPGPSRVITFEDDLIDVEHKDSNQETTFQDELNSVDCPDHMLLRSFALLLFLMSQVNQMRRLRLCQFAMFH